MDLFSLLKTGPPSDPHLSPHIQSICEALDIPHLETRFDIDTGAKEFSINLYPQQKKLNDAILETVRYLNWTRYAIIYEGNNSFPSKALKNSLDSIEIWLDFSFKQSSHLSFTRTDNWNMTNWTWEAWWKLLVLSQYENIRTNFK